MYPNVHKSNHPRIQPSTNSTIHKFNHPQIQTFTRPNTRVSKPCNHRSHLQNCRFVHSTIHPRTYPSPYLSIHVPIHPDTPPAIDMPIPHPCSALKHSPNQDLFASQRRLPQRKKERSKKPLPAHIHTKTRPGLWECVS
jgi:hypothetical protein